MRIKTNIPTITHPVTFENVLSGQMRKMVLAKYTKIKELEVYDGLVYAHFQDDQDATAYVLKNGPIFNIKIK